MNNPWLIDDAFDVMFSETVQLNITRNGMTYSTPLDACVFPIEDVDPFVDSDTDNETKRISVILRIEDVRNALNDKPQLQDTIKLIDDSVWGICEVKAEQSWYKVIARSFK